MLIIVLSVCCITMSMFFLTLKDILNFLMNPKQGPEFVMEVTDKTRADVKVTILSSKSYQRLFFSLMSNREVIRWSSC